MSSSEFNQTETVLSLMSSSFFNTYTVSLLFMTFDAAKAVFVKIMEDKTTVITPF